MKYLVTSILLYFIIIANCVGQYTWPQDYIYVMNNELNQSSVSQKAYGLYFYQQVKGEGFHNFKDKIVAAQLGLNESGHGSGTIDYKSLRVAFLNTRISNILGDTLAVSNNRIRMNESVDFVYGPTNFYFGKFFKSNPFRSKGAEETCLKNYPADQKGVGVSMNARFDNSEVYSKDITADMHRRSRTSGFEDVNYSSLTFSNNSLSIETAFTGNLHIGAFRFKGIPPDDLPSGNDTKVRFNVTNVIDEDYSGTFSITKRMVDTYSYGISTFEENFLPCCFEGWDTMPPIYQRKFGRDVKGIFDCRCHMGYAQGLPYPLTVSKEQFTEPQATGESFQLSQ
jgi:hypothetical protein